MSGELTLTAVFANADAILLDFDGPVCAVFSGITDLTVATQLREVLAAHGVSMPAGTAPANDPLAVLEFAATLDRAILAAVEDRLVEAEVVAARVADPTPGAHEFMAAVRSAGKHLVIVSNNAATSIHAYLDQHGLGSLVEFVVGRAYAQPELMKPHPHTVRVALDWLGVAKESAVLIGDSVTDIEVAIATGVPSIGFANKPDKAELLKAAGQTVGVASPDGMDVLAAAVRRS